MTAWPTNWPTLAWPRSRAAHRSRALHATPARMALLAVLLYGGYALAAISLHGTGSFAAVGTWVPKQSRASATINANFHANDRFGYDGEFFLAIALDPVRAHSYLDKPAYRYGRIGYPMLARAVALGQAAWIRAALVLINLLAVGAGTFCVAKLLARNGYRPGLSAFYFLYPGLFLAFMNDLSEPLAYALAALGLVVLGDWSNRRRLLLAGVVFALAALTRESTLLIPVTFAGFEFVRTRKLHPPLTLATIALLPCLAWVSFVHIWLGSQGGAPALETNPIPFSGLSNEPDLWQAFVVAIPVSLVLIVVATRLARGPRTVGLVALAASLLVFGVYLAPLTYQGYISSGRLQIGAVLLVLFSLHALRGSKLGVRLTNVAVVFAYLPLIPILALLGEHSLAPIR